MKRVVAFLAFMFVACSVSENTSRTEIGLFHPQRAAADSTMEEP